MGRETWGQHKMSKGAGGVRRLGLAMKQKLESGLLPVKLNIVDESHLHAGHRFVKESGITQETHFKVFVVSKAFEGKSLVARHRLCYSLIDQEIKEGVHAVALTTRTPEEDKEKEVV